MSRDELVIDFCGEVTRVAPDEQLTFGRSGDLVIDENRHLHRILGKFEHRSGMWWLRNEGRTLPLLVADLDSRSNSLVAPGREMALSFERSVIRFRAGKTDYELEVRLQGGGRIQAEPEPLDATLDTISMRDIPLTDSQRLLLVALAENKLRDPHSPTTLPANREAAARTGWTMPQFNRKLDNVCRKFTQAGVSGLKGTPGNLASDRRRRLVDTVVATGVVSAADLSLLR